MKGNNLEIVWSLLRIALGWIFLWPFFDKLLGLGYTTPANRSWLAGVSPTLGFLKGVSHGLFPQFYQSLAGNPVVDWLFMIGLLAIGTCLVLGIGIRLASFFGIVLTALLLGAVLPPKTNPFIDDHILYFLIFAGLFLSNSGRSLGLANWWDKTKLVRQFPILA